MRKAGICLLAFAAISIAMRNGWLDPMDTVVREILRNPAFGGWAPLAIRITDAGSLTVELIVCTAAAVYLRLFTGRYGPPFLLFLNLGGVWFLNFTLKELYRRDRPTVRHLVEAGGYSFPSGHSMSSAAVYGMIGYLLWRAFRIKWKHAWTILCLTALLVLSIGWSRIYLGVHFLSDVLAGYAAGGFCLILFTAIYRRIDPDK